MRHTGGDVEDRDDEMEEIRWFPLERARKRAAYRGERDVLARAAELLAVSVGDALLAIAIGLGSGVLSGLFGVGGGIVMTPAVDAFLPVPEIVALETPLPVIFPTAIAGAYTYWKAGEVDVRAATLMAPLGLVGARGRGPPHPRDRCSAPVAGDRGAARLPVGQHPPRRRARSRRAGPGRSGPVSTSGSDSSPASCRGCSASAAAS